jgi:hypothetical protein
MLAGVLDRLLWVPLEGERHDEKYAISDACGMRLTTGASAAGSPLPARTNLRSAASSRDAAPGRSPGPARPVGCMRGLGGPSHRNTLAPAKECEQLAKGLQRSKGKKVLLD